MLLASFFALATTTDVWQAIVADVTKTGNGERQSGNECTAVTRLSIQNGGTRSGTVEWRRKRSIKTLILPLGRRTRLQCN